MMTMALILPSPMAGNASVSVMPGLVGILEPPGLAELAGQIFHRHHLVAGVHVGQPAHVAGALHVVLAAKRIEPGGFPADIAGEHAQVGQGLHVVHAGDVLGDAHGVENGGSFGLAVKFGHLFDGFGRHAGDFGHLFGRVLFDHLQQLFKVLGALLDERFVVPAVFVDDMHHAVDERHVGAQCCRAWTSAMAAS